MHVWKEGVLVLEKIVAAKMSPIGNVFSLEKIGVVFGVNGVGDDVFADVPAVVERIDDLPECVHSPHVKNSSGNRIRTVLP